MTQLAEREDTRPRVAA